MRAAGGGGGGGRGGLAFGQIYLRAGCVSPHASGVQVPSTVPFNLSFVTGWYIFTTKHIYLVKKKNQSQ